MKSNLITNLLSVLITLFFSFNTFAQVDNQFWFAVPFATADHDGNSGQTDAARLVITNVDKYDDTVMVVHPYNPVFSPISVVLAAGETKSVTLTPYMYSLSNTTNSISSPNWTTVDNNALHLYSKHYARFTSYFEHHPNSASPGSNSPEIWSLKGVNALGEDFWVPFQTQLYNQKFTNFPAYSSFDIVATQPGVTTVWVTLPAGKSDAAGHAAGSTFTVTLSQGQTYSVAPKLVSETNSVGKTWTIPSRNPADRLCGSHVTSSQAIAITIKDDSNFKGTAYDMIGDQIVPTTNIEGDTLVGREYIVMRGKIVNTLSPAANPGTEAIYILATQNNTQVYIRRINGTADSLLATINAGVQVTYVVPGSASSVYVRGSKPIYVFHVSGFVHEVGGALIPTIDRCTGSQRVSFVRSIGTTSVSCTNTAQNNIFLNIFVRTEAVDSFYIKVGTGTRTHLGNATWFEPVGTTGWSALKEAYRCFSYFVTANTTVNVENTMGLFHLGMMNGVSTGGGARYGYFSNYAEENAQLIVVPSGTNLYVADFSEPIQLAVNGAKSCRWLTKQYIVDSTDITHPKVLTPEGTFVKIKVACDFFCRPADTLEATVCRLIHPNAKFTVSTTNICSGNTITVKNFSEKAVGYSYTWGDSYSTTTSSMDSVVHQYVNNTTEPKVFSLNLQSISMMGATDDTTINITVYPALKADFSPLDTAVLNDITINYKNLTAGATDYSWCTRDNVSTEAQPTFTFTKTSSFDTLLYVKLIAKNTYCVDTTTGWVRFPFVPSDTISPFTKFKTSVSKFCAEADVTFKNLSELGYSYTWNFGDGSAPYSTSSNADVSHHYANIFTSKKVYKINLTVYNKAGTYKTYTDSVIAYPDLIASFAPDQTAGCDSFAVHFTDKTAGEASVYQWSANGSVFSSEQNPVQKFKTTGYGDVVQTVKLKVSNEMCSDSAAAYIKTYKRPEAAFSISTNAGFSPLDVVIKNSSVGATSNTWTIQKLTAQNNLSQFPVKYTNGSALLSTDTIMLEVSDDHGCKDSTSKVITIYPTAKAIANSNVISGKSLLAVSFASQSVNTSYQIWHFSDGTKATEPEITHTFTNTGTTPVSYPVKLIVGNEYGSKDSTTLTIMVNPDCSTQASLTVNSLKGKSPFTVEFTNQSINCEAYNWTVDGVSVSTQKDFTFTFQNNETQPKQHEVWLKTSDAYCSSDSISKIVTVIPNCATVAAFTADNLSGKTPFEVHFTNQSVNASAFVWKIDQTTTSTNEHLDYTFINDDAASRSFVVQLISTDTYCDADSTETTVVVLPKDAPTAVSTLSTSQPVIAYPIPTHGKVTLEYSLDKKGKVSISTYSSTGKRLFVTTETKDKGLHQHTLNLEKYPAQLFIVKVEIDGKEYQLSVIKE
jgi:PKD repeat protein